MNWNIKSFKSIKKDYFPKIAVKVVISFILIYFIFHSIYGARGFIAYYKLHSELSTSLDKLNELKTERLNLENKTKLLRPDSLDRDMLDEKVREVLAVAKPSEKIFSNNDNQ